MNPTVWSKTKTDAAVFGQFAAPGDAAERCEPADSGFLRAESLEIALLANRQGHRSAWRSRGWRTLGKVPGTGGNGQVYSFPQSAQEIIELIVRVRESGGGH